MTWRNHALVPQLLALLLTSVTACTRKSSEQAEQAEKAEQAEQATTHRDAGGPATPPGPRMPFRDAGDYTVLAIPRTVDDVPRLLLPSPRDAPIIAVSTMSELVSALADEITIVLRPGEYRIPADGSLGTDGLPHWDGTSIHDVKRLNIVGLGYPPPKIIQEDGRKSALGVKNAENLTIYNLSIGHDGGSCNAPVLHLESSTRIDLVGTDLYGSGAQGFVASSIDGLGFHHGRIHDCNSALFRLTRSSARVRDSQLDSNYGFEGIVVDRSDLDMARTQIHDNPIGTSDDAYLFWLAPPVREDSGGEPDRERTSHVVLRGMTIGSNSFSAFTDVPSRLDMDAADNRIADAYSPPMTSPSDRRWWCTCYRTGEVADYTLDTQCLVDAQACRDFEDAVADGEVAGALAATTVHACRHVPGETPREALGSTFERAARGWVSRGECRLPSFRAPDWIWATTASTEDPRPLVPAGHRRPPAAQRREWRDLLPLYDAYSNTKSSTGIAVSAESDAAYRRFSKALHSDGDTEVFAGDPGMPPQVRKLPLPWIVSEDGVFEMEHLRSATFDETPIGAYWLVEYAGAVPLPGIAVSAEPSLWARLRPAPERIPTEFDHWWVTLAREVSDDYILSAPLTDGDATWTVQVVPGSFPFGSTTLLAVNTMDYPGRDTEGLSVVFTVDAQGRVVQRVADVGVATKVDYLVDLDGDDFDEVVMTAQGLEDVSRFIVRLTETETEHIEFYAAGH